MRVDVKKGDLARPEDRNQVQSVESADNAGQVYAVAADGRGSLIEILIACKYLIEPRYMLGVVSRFLARAQLGASIVSRVIDFVNVIEAPLSGAWCHGHTQSPPVE